MAKFNPNGIIPEIRASCAEEPPLWVSVTAAFEVEAICLALGAIGDQESDDGETEKDPFLKNPNRCARDEREISLTVAIYRRKDSQGYAARGSIGSASSHRLTRG